MMRGGALNLFNSVRDGVRETNDSFFSLRRLYSLKDSFNSTTGYYDSWYNYIFNYDNAIYLFYAAVIAFTCYFIYENYETLRPIAEFTGNAIVYTRNKVGQAFLYTSNKVTQGFIYS